MPGEPGELVAVAATTGDTTQPASASALSSAPTSPAPRPDSPGIDESVALPREAHAVEQRHVAHDRDRPAAGEHRAGVVEERGEEDTQAEIDEELGRAEQPDDVDRVTDLALLAPDVLLALGVDRQLDDDVGQRAGDAEAEHDEDVRVIVAEVEAAAGVHDAEHPAVAHVVHDRAERRALVEVARLVAIDVVDDAARDQQAPARPPVAVVEDGATDQADHRAEPGPRVGVERQTCERGHHRVQHPVDVLAESEQVHRGCTLDALRRRG